MLEDVEARNACNEEHNVESMGFLARRKRKRKKESRYITEDFLWRIITNHGEKKKQYELVGVEHANCQIIGESLSACSRCRSETQLMITVFPAYSAPDGESDNVV